MIYFFHGLLLFVVIFLGFTSNLAYGSDDLHHQQLAEVIDFCQNHDQATDWCYLLAEDFSAYQDLNEPLQLDDNQLHYAQSAAVLSIPVFLRYLSALANLAKNNMIIASTIALLAGAMVFKKYYDSFLDSLIINAPDFDGTSEQSRKNFLNSELAQNINNLQKGPDHENNNLVPVLPSQKEQTEKLLIKENDYIFFSDTPKSYVNFNLEIEDLFVTRSGRCSGVHIGDGVILTAGHCLGTKDYKYKITKIIYHAFDPQTNQSSEKVVEADKNDFVYYQEIHPSLDIGLLFTNLKKPIAGSAEIVGQGESSFKYDSLDDFFKDHPTAKTYLTGAVEIDSSLDVSKFVNNKIVQSQPVNLQKYHRFFINSEFTASIPAGFSSQSKFHSGDSGSPIYLQVDGKEVLFGVLIGLVIPKVPEYRGDKLKKIKQIWFISQAMAKHAISGFQTVACGDYACADYPSFYTSWIVKTKNQVISSE